MKVRQGSGGTEGAGQPRPHRRADQPLVEEAIGGEIGKLVLAEVEGGHGDERTHHGLHHLQPAFVRDIIADHVETAIDAFLCADARRLADVARPALDRVAAVQADVEGAADVTLRALIEAGKLLHFDQGQRPIGRLDLRCHTHSFYPAGHAWHRLSRR